jgi:hypothetical protein
LNIAKAGENNGKIVDANFCRQYYSLRYLKRFKKSANQSAVYWVGESSGAVPVRLDPQEKSVVRWPDVIAKVLPDDVGANIGNSPIGGFGSPTGRDSTEHYAASEVHRCRSLAEPSPRSARLHEVADPVIQSSSIRLQEEKT